MSGEVDAIRESSPEEDAVAAALPDDHAEVDPFWVQLARKGKGKNKGMRKGYNDVQTDLDANQIFL